MKPTTRKKINSLIMTDYIKFFDLGVKYPNKKFAVGDVKWLAEEHMKPQADKLLDAIVKLLEKDE